MMQELYSPQAERSVIGSLFIEPESFYRLGTLQADDFYDSEHQIIFAIAGRIIESGEQLDLVDVAQDHKIGLGYLGDMVKNTPTSANANIYAKIIIDYSQKRQLKEIFHNALINVETLPLDEFLPDAQADIESVARHEIGDDNVYDDIINAALFHVERLDSTDGVIGAPTGIDEIDQRTGGLYGQRLWCVAARPSIGKTALTLQWAIHSAEHGHKVGICSLEMDEEELALRGLAHKLHVNLSGLSHGDKETLRIAKSNMEKINTDDMRQNIYLDTKTFSLSGIVSRITEWRRKHNISYVIVDHIGLIEVSNSENRNDQLGKVTRTLKKLTKKLNIPIVVVSQLNRSSEKENRKPKLSDLRDSGNIEQDIDIGLFLHGMEKEFVGIEVEMGLLKNRKGAKGWIDEKYNFDGATQTFKPLMKF